MADEEERSFAPSRPEANRAREQGLGVGQQEMDAQRDPNRFQTATDPARAAPFDDDLQDATNADRPSQADFGDTDLRAANGDGQARAAETHDRETPPDRNAAGLGDVQGDLGAGTPANVDIHDLGQPDKPEDDWGEAADEGTYYSSTNSDRGGRTELERGQGAKTRQANKDIVSRRA